MIYSGNSRTLSDFAPVFGRWNFNELSTITKDGSDNISQARGFGVGNNFNASGSGNTVYPVWTANAFNGKAAARFTHASQSGMTAGNVTPWSSSGFTMFAFAQVSSTAGNQMIFSKHQTGSAGCFYVDTDSPNIARFMTVNSTPTRVDITGTIQSDQFTIIAIVYDASANRMALFNNENLVSTGVQSGVIQSQPAVPLMMGTYANSSGGANFTLDGYIGEIICFATPLSDVMIKAVISQVIRPYWGYWS